MAVDLGDLVPLTIDIRDASGTLANAGVVTLTVGLPDGTSINLAPSNPTTGRYQYDYPTSQAGRHTVRWLATGGNASAYTDAFDVRPADLGGILSLSAAKAALNIASTATTDDEEIRSLIAAVTLVIEDYRKETVVRRTVTERIDTDPSRTLLLRKAPIISLTSVVDADGYTWPSGDLEIRDAEIGEIASEGDPFHGDLTIVYVAGRAIIPANYVEAAKIILKHLWQTQQTPGMGSRVFGGEEISVGIAGMGYALPNRAAELLGGRGLVVM